MSYWLVKSEPYKWSWDDQLSAGTNCWQKEVRNYQARNNLNAMAKGDQVMFYHSNEGKEIVGIMSVEGEAYPDPRDESGKFVTVDVKASKSLNKTVPLATLKGNPELANLALIRQPRLSVMPVSNDEWDIILNMADEQ